jgi:hypothetical protein
MKVILNVPDEGYSERTWWRLFWTYLMKVILNVPDEGYSERTWWWLFWTYLMMVILNVSDITLQWYVIKFVSDLRQEGGFLRVPRFPSPIKLTATK